MYNSKTVLELFDEVPLETWQSVLNTNMDYHFLDIPIENNSVFNNVKTVLDVGCGWGGMMRDLSHIYNIKCTGITNSPQQKEYIGDNVILADANTLNISDMFDLAIFIQSFTHMADDAVYSISKNTSKIFISDFVFKGDHRREVPDWCMTIRTQNDYIEIFDKAGFEIKSFKEYPLNTYNKNAKLWLENIQNNKITNGWQIIVLERFCKFILKNMNTDMHICGVYAEKK